jgi:acyl dehydratase
VPIDHRFIGREYPAISYEMGREKIREYARAVGDLNPLYLDEEYGRQSPYGDMIAPPAMASQYAVMPADLLFHDDEVGVDYEMLVHGEQDYQYFQVVRPGDRLQITGRIKDIHEKRSLQFVIFETEVVNQRGEKVVVATGSFVIRPRGEA